MYRVVITVVPASPAAQASSVVRVYAPGEPSPFAFTACLWGDGDGARAEAEGRAAAARHAGVDTVEVTVEREVRAAAGDGAAALAALVALTDELDALQAAARAAYPAQVSCRRGCDSCCHQQVGVSRIEIARLAAAVQALSAEARAALAATVAAGSNQRCGALDAGGGCQLYDARPVVCRSHGLVYLTRHLRVGRSLPVLQSSCHLNYQGELADEARAYDFAAGSDRLLELDDAFAEQVGFGADLTVGRSIALADVLPVLLSPAR